MIFIVKAEETSGFFKTNRIPTLERWTFSESTNGNLDVDTCMLILLCELGEAWESGKKNSCCT
jgi:hypothetical protein